MTNINPIALKQIRWAIAACNDKRGIEFIIHCHNACCERGEMPAVFALPTGGYKRYAPLLSDLLEAERQILNMLKGSECRGNDIEAAHAEALDINRWIDSAHNAGGVAFEGAADAIIAVRERAHAEALLINERMTAIDVQMAFISMPPFSQAVAFAEAHAEALAMNEEISLVREIESLTYVQAIAYSDQWDFFNSAPEAQVQMIEAAHAEALANEIEEDHELALKMNCWFDALRGRFDLFWSDNVAPVRARILATHHVNALHINDLINGLVGEIREAMTEAEANEGDQMIAIKIEGTGLELESADVRFAAETAGRLARVAA